MITAIPAFLHADAASELAQAARSPFEIQRFVETHESFDWAPLWKALKLSDDTFLPGCEEEINAEPSCSSVLIRVPVVNPEQIIVVLHHDPSGFEVYLRFLAEAPSSGGQRWRFAGHYQPNVKYFPPRHRIVMFGQAPYLVITEQGVSGSGVSSELDSWLDLTQSGLRPVFGYTSKGETHPFPGGISRREQGAISSLGFDPVESITVRYSVAFGAVDQNGNTRNLGGRSDTAVYTRHRAGEQFKLDRTRSPAFSAEVDGLYNEYDSDPSNEDFLRLDFISLKEIASGSGGKEKEWLRQFLAECGETPEKKQLLVLLRPAGPAGKSR